MKDGDEFYCLPLNLRFAGCGILLNPTEKKGQYTRCGYFAVLTAHKPDSGERFLDLCREFDATTNGDDALYERKGGIDNNGIQKYVISIIWSMEYLIDCQSSVLGHCRFVIPKKFSSFMTIYLNLALIKNPITLYENRIPCKPKFNLLSVASQLYITKQSSSASVVMYGCLSLPQSFPQGAQCQ